MSQRLLEEITARLVSTTAHAERLRTQLTEAEDDLDRLRAAEQVVKEILAEVPAAEQACDAGQDPADMPTPVYRVTLTAARAAAQAEQGVEFLSGGRLIPFPHEADDAGDLPADYQALLAAVDAAGGPVICKAILRAARTAGRLRAGGGGPGQAETAGRARLAAQDPQRRVRPVGLTNAAPIPGSLSLTSP